MCTTMTELDKIDIGVVTCIHLCKVGHATLSHFDTADIDFRIEFILCIQ